MHLMPVYKTLSRWKQSEGMARKESQLYKRKLDSSFHTMNVCKFSALHYVCAKGRRRRKKSQQTGFMDADQMPRLARFINNKINIVIVHE